MREFRGDEGVMTNQKNPETAERQSEFSLQIVKEEDVRVMTCVGPGK